MYGYSRIVFDMKITNLTKRRIEQNLTQGELAYRSKVEIRTIQDYEQRRRNINHAKAQTVRSLAKILKCNMEDILEDL